MATQEFKPFERKFDEALFKEQRSQNTAGFAQFNGFLVQVNPINVPSTVYMVLDEKRRAMTWATTVRLHGGVGIVRGDPIYSLIPAEGALSSDTCLMEGLNPDGTHHGTVFLWVDGQLRPVTGRAAQQYQFVLGDNIVRIPVELLFDPRRFPPGSSIPERPE
jgi:hypothetical protein